MSALRANRSGRKAKFRTRDTFSIIFEIEKENLMKRYNCDFKKIHVPKNSIVSTI